jgi:hypothetical protein
VLAPLGAALRSVCTTWITIAPSGMVTCPARPATITAAGVLPPIGDAGAVATLWVAVAPGRVAAVFPGPAALTAAAVTAPFGDAGAVAAVWLAVAPGRVAAVFPGPAALAHAVIALAVALPLAAAMIAEYTRARVVAAVGATVTALTGADVSTCIIVLDRAISVMAVSTVAPSGYIARCASVAACDVAVAGVLPPIGDAGAVATLWVAVTPGRVAAVFPGPAELTGAGVVATGCSTLTVGTTWRVIAACGLVARLIALPTRLARAIVLPAVGCTFIAMHTARFAITACGLVARLVTFPAVLTGAVVLVTIDNSAIIN